MTGAHSFLKHHDTFISSVIILAINVISLVVLFPGFVQADHLLTISDIAVGTPRQMHSLLWGYFAYPLLYLSGSIALYGLVQIVLFTVIILFSLTRLKSVGVIKSTIPWALVYAIFPTFLLYNLLYSSDVIFAYTLVALTALLIEAVQTKGTCLQDKKYCIFLALFLICSSCLRKNAIILFFIVCIVLALYYKRYSKRVLTIFLACLVGIACFNVVLPAAVGATSSPSQELISVPCLQVAHVFAADGNMPEEAREYFCSIRSAEEWKEAYLPYIADLAKDGVQLTPEFLSNWAQLGLENKGLYLQTYYDLESPFWKFGYVGYAGLDIPFCGTEIDFALNERFAFWNGDKLSTTYLQQFETPRSNLWNHASTFYAHLNERPVPVITFLVDYLFINRALPFWTLIVLALLSLKAHVLGKYAICALPVLIIMITLLLFAPVASFRYSVEMYYALPILLMWVIYILRKAPKHASKEGESPDRHNSSEENILAESTQ